MRFATGPGLADWQDFGPGDLVMVTKEVPHAEDTLGVDFEARIGCERSFETFPAG